MDVVLVDASDFSTAIDENPALHQVLGSIVGTTNKGTVTYELIQQSPTGALTVDVSSGVLTVADPALFDYEANPVITATVRVANDQLVKEAIVHIQLNDVLEIVVTTTDFSTSIDENPAVGQEIGTLTSSTNHGEVSYEIVSQAPAGALAIDASTGVLSVADRTLFDFEAHTSVRATVKVSNGSVYMLSSVTVLLNDVDNCTESQKNSESYFSSLMDSRNYTKELTMDLVTHSYTFKMSVSGSICSIGYQGVTDEPYLIEIVDAQNTILYSGMHSFSTTQQAYINIPPVQLIADQSYTIKRTLENYSSMSEIIGNMISSPRNTKEFFPLTFGKQTITGTPYTNNLPEGMIVIPYITFGFTEI